MLFRGEIASLESASNLELTLANTVGFPRSSLVTKSSTELRGGRSGEVPSPRGSSFRVCAERRTRRARIGIRFFPRSQACRGVSHAAYCIPSVPSIIPGNKRKQIVASENQFICAKSGAWCQHANP
jgi:hypothetical protein